MNCDELSRPSILDWLRIRNSGWRGGIGIPRRVDGRKRVWKLQPNGKLKLIKRELRGRAK